MSTLSNGYLIDSCERFSSQMMIEFQRLGPDPPEKHKLWDFELNLDLSQWKSRFPCRNAIHFHASIQLTGDRPVGWITTC